MEYNFKSSIQLKSVNGQTKLPLRIQVRIYRKGNVGELEKLMVDVKDTDGEIIKLLKEQISKNTVIDHEKYFRYNELVRFTRNAITQECGEQLKGNTRIDRKKLKNQVYHRVSNEFELFLKEKLNTQKVKVTLSDGDTFMVDEAVLENFKKRNIPTEPELIPIGDNEYDVELNDWDAEDHDAMLVLDQMRFENDKKLQEIEAMSPKERFLRGYYDKENIGHVFASIKYTDEPDPYKRLAIRIYEYSYYRKVSLDMRHLTTEWVQNFFEFLLEHGYTHCQTKNFDPFKFDGTILEGKKIKKYNVQNVYKMAEQFQTVLKRHSRHNAKKIDFELVNNHIKDNTGVKKTKDGTRIEHNLLKEEFDLLFKHQFTNDDLFECRKVFSNHHKSKNVRLEIDHLKKARDLFCLMVMSGGVRGYDELMTMTYNKQQHLIVYEFEKTVRYQTNPNKNRIQNPSNEYTEILFQRNNYSLPQLRFELDYCTETMKKIFRSLLKTIAELLDMQREVFATDGYYQIKEILSPYFARKTFSQMMYDNYGFSMEEIEAFTGHIGRKSILGRNYLDKNSIAAKRKLATRIKIEIDDEVKMTA